MMSSKTFSARPWVAASVVVSALVGLGAMAMASASEHGEGPDGMGRPPMPGMDRALPVPPAPPFPLAGPALDHLLRVVQATPEQAEQLRKIGQLAVADLDKQRDAMRDEQRDWLQAFTQPTVDAKAVESLRQKALSRHDALTLRMSQALLDASKVLTVAQRQKLADSLARGQEHAGRHGGEPGDGRGDGRGNGRSDAPGAGPGGEARPPRDRQAPAGSNS